MKNASTWNAVKSNPKMRPLLRLFTLLIIPALVSGCAAAPAEPSLPATDTPVPATITPTMTLPPTQTPVPPTPTLETIDSICSPLDQITLAELNDIITQPYKTPRPKNDDGHHGVDFAFFRFNDIVGIEGLPVDAALPGEVVTILINRDPYGNGLIVETPLKELNPELIAALNLPEVQPTVVPDPRVNCPASGELTFTLSETERSVYILYAHLKEAPVVQVGDQVTCGQQLGLVGNSGISSNAHLHFETRVGPSGARFESMAYYTLQSTEAERYNYCVWRVSNLFELFDPMILLSIQD
jgi:murein DD-endopeptidase MepM/ murein hydrolase activator NlpD